MYKLVHSGKRYELWYLPGSSKFSWRNISNQEWNGGIRPLNYDKYTPYFKCLYDIRSFLVEQSIFPKYIYEEIDGIYKPSHLIKSKKGPYIPIEEANV